MKITLNMPQEFEIDTVRMELPIRYGNEDIPDNFPGRKGETLNLVVDVNTGIIRDWPADFGPYKVDMKVVDGGCYYVMSGNKTIVELEGEYVPQFIPGSYGDYVELDIDANGKVLNWKNEKEWVCALSDCLDD